MPTMMPAPVLCVASLPNRKDPQQKPDTKNKTLRGKQKRAGPTNPTDDKIETRTDKMLRATPWTMYVPNVSVVKRHTETTPVQATNLPIKIQ